MAESLTKEDYAKALAVQSACNLSGVVYSFGVAVTRVWEEARDTGQGTDWVNTHPICVLYADKVLQLAGGKRDENYRRAYEACVARS